MINVSKYLRNQDGMAMLISMSMLLVMSVLGTVMHEVASREVNSAAAFQANEEAFFAADRSVEYALNRDLLLSLDTTTDLATNPHLSNINDSLDNGVLKQGSITDTGPGEMPIKLKRKFGSDFGANYYYINVEAEGPRNSVEKIETQVVRLFKRDDDSIFRTTGGG